jgi:hypothetical protein
MLYEFVEKYALQDQDWRKQMMKMRQRSPHGSMATQMGWRVRDVFGA